MTGSEVFAVIVGIIAAVVIGGALFGSTGQLLGFLLSVVPVLLVLMRRKSQRAK